MPISIVYNFPHGKEHWDLTMSLHSRPVQGAIAVVGLINLISDLYILVLPLPILATLPISKKKRLGLCLIFATAIW